MLKYFLPFTLLLLSCRQQIAPHLFTALEDEVTGLEYTMETAREFAAAVGNWKHGEQPAFDSWHARLEQAWKTGGSVKQVAEAEYGVIREMGEVVGKALPYHEEYYRLDDIISLQGANCLGYAQVLFVLGRALGLSVEAVNVLELHDGKKSYREGRGYNHAACLFTLKNGLWCMLDLAYDMGRGKRISGTFAGSEVFQKEGNYLRVKAGAEMTAHRRIQVLDKAGILGLKWFQKGTAYGKRERWDSAAACFNAAIRLNPMLAEAHNNLGIVHSRKGRYGEAQACFQRCLKLNPAHAQAWYNLGNHYLRAGQIPQALESCSKAIDLDTLHTGALYCRGLAYQKLGRFSEAARDSIRAAELNSAPGG